MGPKHSLALEICSNFVADWQDGLEFGERLIVQTPLPNIEKFSNGLSERVTCEWKEEKALYTEREFSFILECTYDLKFF